MQNVPRNNPAAILQRVYANITVGHYRRMGTDYRIVRPLGTHDWLIILGLSGGGVIRHNAQKISLGPKQLAVFKPEISHDYGTDPGIGYWELIWAHFHAPSDWLPLLSWNEPIPGVLVLDLSRRSAVARRVMGAFLEMYRLASSTLPRRDWLAMNALEGLLLSCDALVSRTRMNLDPRLETVTEHIQRHLSEPHSLHSLAKMAHLSISQLSALFRQHFEVSPRVYIEKRRMDHARRLLLFPSISIKNVAVESGFNDPLYFSKRFRSHSGYSPSDYRKLSLIGRLQDIPCVSEKTP